MAITPFKVIQGQSPILVPIESVSGYYSGRHHEQCGRAVKSTDYILYSELSNCNVLEK